MKKAMLLILLVVAALILGCSQQERPPATPTETPAEYSLVNPGYLTVGK